jgi:hypothetical protein
MGNTTNRGPERFTWIERRIYLMRRRLIQWLAGSDSVVANIWQMGGIIFLRGDAIMVGEWDMEKTPPPDSTISEAEIAYGVRVVFPTKWTGLERTEQGRLWANLSVADIEAYLRDNNGQVVGRADN